MKYLFLALTFLFFTTAQGASPVTQIILVRHAEKGKGKNPELTAFGKKRAQALVQLHKSYPIEAVYSSNFKRTLQTATPLANSLNIRINNKLSPVDYKGLLADIKINFTGKTVFVAGHSNTVPRFINYVKADFNLPDIPESEYSNLFVLQLIGNDAKLTQYTYEATKNGDLEMTKK